MYCSFLVQLDDDIMKQYANESAFVMQVQQANDSEAGTVDVTLTEVDN